MVDVLVLLHDGPRTLIALGLSLTVRVWLCSLRTLSCSTRGEQCGALNRTLLLRQKEEVMAEQRAAESGSRSPAHQGAPEVRDKAQAVSAHVSDTAWHVRETASDSYQQGREQIEQVGQYLEEHIRGKPLQSVLMAAGLGMLLAFLWKK